MDYKDLVQRLNAYSAEYQYHGGITAEAADAIETLIAERDAAIDALNYGGCSTCKYQNLGEAKRDNLEHNTILKALK